MSAMMNPAAPHVLPPFVTAPGDADFLLIATAIILVGATLALGVSILWLHTLPERLAHSRHRLQFEIVAVLGLLALFTHVHAFWVAGLLLALIDLPDVAAPFQRIAASLERIAGATPPQPEAETMRQDGA